ncbi:MAG: cysteine desulfurase [Parcubacteria group bacterium Gr01-1014_66]|nr:MAG: cysteine desulfurase [Parcubacteria group bacterium Gr01-1014_66]
MHTRDLIRSPHSDGVTIYLDYAAATPLDPRIERVMARYAHKEFGNPSSLHGYGVAAKKAVEDARRSVAQILHCRPSEIVFTAGGTEAINLAILGRARAYPHNAHLITSVIEHHAVLRSHQHLEREGSRVTYLPCDRYGIIDPDAVRKAIMPETALVSIMYANNEIGTIEPIQEIAKVIRRAREERRSKNNSTPLSFFTDACQAAGAFDLNIEKLGIDMMALNSGKIYGPKGSGCLYVRGGVRLEPLLYGGGQEKGLRSGTENIPAIIGFAQALKIANQMREKEHARVTKLRDFFIGEIKKRIPTVILNGHPVQRLPNNINISIPHVEGEALVIYLDAEGIAASTGSACSSVEMEPSHVIAALGIPQEYRSGSLRLTMGRKTTKKDIQYVLDVLPKIVHLLKQ